MNNTKTSKSKPMPTLYRVSFLEENYLYMDIDATRPSIAIRKAQSIYDRRGVEGFSIDMKRGGISDWEATPISKTSNDHG